MGGSATAMMTTNKAYMTASTSNSNAAMLRSTGEAQETTGKVQVLAGTAAAGIGVAQILKGMSHQRTANALISGSQANNVQVVKDKDGNFESKEVGDQDTKSVGYVYGTKGTIAEKIIKKNNLNSESGYEFTSTTDYTPTGNEAVDAIERKKYEDARLKQADDARRKSAGKVESIGSEAAEGHIRAKSVVTMQGLMSAATGLQQLASGALSIEAGKKLKRAAAALENSGTNTPTSIYSPGVPNNMADGNTTPTSPSAITGDGYNPDANNEATADNSAAGPPDMGPGLNPNPLPTNVNAGPPAGKFNASLPGNGSPGGGGMGIGSGGSTAPASAGQEENQAKGGSKGEGDRYESGGAFSSGGGGGGKGADNADMNSLLAALQPKKEDNPIGNGIIDYTKNPGDAPLSALSKNANIFVEVSKTIHSKNEHGAVGD
jgi:hypothetical protein